MGSSLVTIPPSLRLPHRFSVLQMMMLLAVAVLPLLQVLTRGGGVVRVAMHVGNTTESTHHTTMSPGSNSRQEDDDSTTTTTNTLGKGKI